MIKKRIIPCLLLKAGRCVKGVNFTNHRDVGHPVTCAKVYEAHGADELIFLDIEASNDGMKTTTHLVEQTADECFMPLCVGGGIQSINDIRMMLHSGADKISINTKAVEDPSFIKKSAEIFGKQCIVVAIDYKKNANGKMEVFIHSGTIATGLEPFEWAVQVHKYGAGEILLTNIDKEGTRTGYDLEMTRKIADAIDIPVIANGGVGSMEDLKKGIVEGHASAVSLASILHFTDQNVIKARNYLITHGIDVRYK